MARPTKQGIEYFSLDVDFFSDIKVRRISKACGPASTSILICLLCNIYRDKGYYIEWDEDLPFVVADTIGTTEGAVEEDSSTSHCSTNTGSLPQTVFKTASKAPFPDVKDLSIFPNIWFLYAITPFNRISVYRNPPQPSFCMQKPSPTEFLHAKVHKVK